MSVIYNVGIGNSKTPAKTDRQKFYEKISKLTKSQKKSLGKELANEQHKVNMMDLTNYSRDKARQLYRKATIEGKKRAYKKFGITYKTSIYTKK